MRASPLLAALVLGLGLSGSARADGPDKAPAPQVQERWLRRIADIEAGRRPPLLRRLLNELDDGGATQVALALQRSGREPDARSIVARLGPRALEPLLIAIANEDALSPAALELLPEPGVRAHRALPRLRLFLARAQGRRWLRLAEAILRLDTEDDRLLSQVLTRFRRAARLPIEPGLKGSCCLADIAGMLARLGPRALPALAPVCRNRKDPIHNEMIFVLGDMAASHPVVVTALLRWIQEGPEAARRLAMRALGRSGRGGPEVIRGLAAFLEAKNPAAPAAREALRELEDAAAPAVRTLIQDLGSPTTRRRVLAARALGALGNAARPAVMSLRRGLKDASAQARVAQAAALARVSHDPAARAVLRSALAEPELAEEAQAGLQALRAAKD